MKKQQPKTIADFESILNTTLELMSNPYCDHLMFMSLIDKRDNALAKIKELKNIELWHG